MYSSHYNYLKICISMGIHGQTDSEAKSIKLNLCVAWMCTVLVFAFRYICILIYCWSRLQFICTMTVKTVESMGLYRPQKIFAVVYVK